MGGPQRMHSVTGPDAIEHYLQAEEKGRLIQSLKSHLPAVHSPALKSLAAATRSKT